MTLLERLSLDIPHFNTSNGVRNNYQYLFVKEHFDEITQARQKGYSWTQIKNAANDISNDAFCYSQLEYYYNKVRKETTYGQSASIQQ